MAEIHRRRFLALCGAAVPGIWAAGTGFVQLPAQMVFAMSGTCSFCGEGAAQRFGLAGVTWRPHRICDFCLDLSFDIVQEEAGLSPPPPAPPPEPSYRVAEVDLPSEILDAERAYQRLKDQLLAAGEHGDPHVDALADALKLDSEVPLKSSDLAPAPPPEPRLEALTCSFCDKTEHQVAKLIAGPAVCICDSCIGDARSLFMRYGWRPEV